MIRKNKDIKMVLFSDYKCEKLVTEIYYKEILVASINQDNGIENLIVELFQCSIDFDTLQEALLLAKKGIVRDEKFIMEDLKMSKD